MKRINETKLRYMLTIGLSRVENVDGRRSVVIEDPDMIEHIPVMLSIEESQAWHRMVKEIVMAQAKEKNKQWKGN